MWVGVDGTSGLGEPLAAWNRMSCFSIKQVMSDSHRLLLKLGEGIKIDAKDPRESLNIFE